MKELESKADNITMRRKDAILISFFCGAITIIIFMIITLLSIPDHSFQKQIGNTESELLSSLHTFRFLFVLIFILAATGCVVKLLR